MFLPDPVKIFTELISLAVLFYFIIPVGGAFYVRRMWRFFRRSLRASLDFPLALPSFTTYSGSLGLHRFLGRLEAIEGSDRLWIRGPHGSLTADMKNAAVYNLTDPGRDDQIYDHLYPYSLPNESLTRMSWNDVFSLTEGTRLFLYGNLRVQNGRYCMESCREMPLTVIIFNEDPFTLVPRCIWSGRQSNEFWNFLTPWSILTGSLLLLIFSVWLFLNANNYRIQLISLFLSFLPVVLFLPPGVFFFNFYKRLWDRGRKSRAERDLITLPLAPGMDGRAHKSDCSEEEILYTRKPSEWVCPGEYDPVLYRLPEGLIEMAERKLEGHCISYPENPEILAGFCQKRAFLYESLSGIILTGGLILNYLLIWFVVGLFN